MVMRLTVLGTGYLGATHAACMAELGHEVLGVDVDESKVQMLSDGVVPFWEPGLDELVRKHLDSGRLRFTTSFEEAADFGDVHFLCVGTPQTPGSYAADMRQVHGAVDSLAPHLSRPSLVVGKSTVPVGTAQAMVERLQAGAPGGDQVEVAWNPEFLREGHAVQDTLEPDRLVIGTSGPTGEQVLRQVYAPLVDAGVPVVLADLPTAELVKVSANAFLATKISFINAMAELCETVGGDVTVLSKALALDPRIGGLFLQPGLGFGGGCLPKDIRAFMHRAGELGATDALAFLREVDAINQRRRLRTVDLTREMVGGDLSGAVVAVLGAAFKPDSDDIRDSPALEVASRLYERGADVRVTDPKALHNARTKFPQLRYEPALEDAVRDADVVLLLTEWREYRALDPEHVGALVRQRRVVDGRSALDAEAWRGAGWTYKALGRP